MLLTFIQPLWLDYRMRMMYIPGDFGMNYRVWEYNSEQNSWKTP